VKSLEIKFADNKKELDKIILIRKTVFVEEQNVPLDLELDGLDDAAKHIIAYLGEKPVGCARLRINKKKAKLERVAILKDYRYKGFGSQIVNSVIDYCRNNNLREIYLHSRIDTTDFYKKLGFKTRGKVFLDAGIKHVEMFLNV